MREIYCHNNKHLGDCIQTIHYLTNVSEKYDKIKFYFYCQPQYRPQIQEIITEYKDKIILLEQKANSDKNSIEMWIAGYGDYGKINENTLKICNGFFDQSVSFLFHWIRISQILNIDCPFKTKNDLIYNQKIINTECKHKENYDYLFINSVNQSVFFDTYDSDVIRMLNILNKKNKKFITTNKIQGISCTLDYDLSVLEIAKLSQNVKNIIAVNTGPLHLCMNKWTISKIEKFIVWSPVENFNYGPNFISVKTLGEIDESSI